MIQQLCISCIYPTDFHSFLFTGIVPASFSHLPYKCFPSNNQHCDCHTITLWYSEIQKGWPYPIPVHLEPPLISKTTHFRILLRCGRIHFISDNWYVMKCITMVSVDNAQWKLRVVILRSVAQYHTTCSHQSFTSLKWMYILLKTFEYKQGKEKVPSFAVSRAHILVPTFHVILSVLTSTFLRTLPLPDRRNRLTEIIGQNPREDLWMCWNFCSKVSFLVTSYILLFLI